MRFCELVEMGAVDKSKEVALYRDEWLSAANLHADIFNRSPDKSMLNKTLALLREVLNLDVCLLVASFTNHILSANGNGASRDGHLASHQFVNRSQPIET